MRLIIAISLISFFSCSKDKNSILVNSYGERITSIRYEHDGRSSKGTFIYLNDTVQIIQESTRKFHLKYEAGRLRAIQTIRRENSLLYSIDSLIYNSENQLVRIDCYSLQKQGGITLDNIYSFEYNQLGKIVRKKLFKENTKEEISIREYEWENENTCAQRAYDKAGNLEVETFYEYDNKRNFWQQDPRKLKGFEYWNTNNIVRTVSRDYTGRIEFYCYECNTRYKYNLDDSPVEQKLDWGAKRFIEYE